MGPPPVPAGTRVDRHIEATGKVVLPGLVNTHHHLPQVLTRNVPRVQEAPLFRWLVELYEVWRHLDAAAVTAAAQPLPTPQSSLRSKRCRASSQMWKKAPFSGLRSVSR